MAASVVAGHDAGGRQPRVQSTVEENREKAKKPPPQQNIQSKSEGGGGVDAKPKAPAQPNKKQDKHAVAVISTNQKNHVASGGITNGKGQQIVADTQQQLPAIVGKMGNNQSSNSKGKSVQSLNSINHVQSKEDSSQQVKSSGSAKARTGGLSQKQLEELSVQTVAQTSTSESSLQTRNHSKSPCHMPSTGVGKMDSSQSESSNSDWGSEEMEAEEMRIIAMSRTDDDKLSKYCHLGCIALVAGGVLKVKPEVAAVLEACA